MSSSVLVAGGNDTDNKSQALALGRKGSSDHHQRQLQQQQLQRQRHPSEERDRTRRKAQRLRAPAHDGANRRSNSKANKSSTSGAMPTAGDGTLGEQSLSYPPGMHLWTQPQRRAPTVSAFLPLPSPMFPTEWWRRPPSPIHWHMRPLWKGAFAFERHLTYKKKPNGMDDADGMPEQPNKLMSTESIGGQTPFSSNPSCLSQGSTFFARKSEEASGSVRPSGGKRLWGSRLAEFPPPALAPPPPTTTAPTIGGTQRPLAAVPDSLAAPMPDLPARQNFDSSGWGLGLDGASSPPQTGGTPGVVQTPPAPLPPGGGGPRGSEETPLKRTGSLLEQRRGLELKLSRSIGPAGAMHSSSRSGIPRSISAGDLGKRRPGSTTSRFRRSERLSQSSSVFPYAKTAGYREPRPRSVRFFLGSDLATDPAAGGGLARAAKAGATGDGGGHSESESLAHEATVWGGERSGRDGSTKLAAVRGTGDVETGMEGGGKSGRHRDEGRVVPLSSSRSVVGSPSVTSEVNDGADPAAMSAASERGHAEQAQPALAATTGDSNTTGAPGSGGKMVGSRVGFAAGTHESGRFASDNRSPMAFLSDVSSDVTAFSHAATSNSNCAGDTAVTRLETVASNEVQMEVKGGESAQYSAPSPSSAHNAQDTSADQRPTVEQEGGEVVDTGRGRSNDKGKAEDNGSKASAVIIAVAETGDTVNAVLPKRLVSPASSRASSAAVMQTPGKRRPSGDSSSGGSIPGIRHRSNLRGSLRRPSPRSSDDRISSPGERSRLRTRESSREYSSTGKHNGSRRPAAGRGKKPQKRPSAESPLSIGGSVGRPRPITLGIARRRPSRDSELKLLVRKKSKPTSIGASHEDTEPADTAAVTSITTSTAVAVATAADADADVDADAANSKATATATATATTGRHSRQRSNLVAPGMPVRSSTVPGAANVERPADGRAAVVIPRNGSGGWSTSGAEEGYGERRTLSGLGRVGGGGGGRRPSGSGRARGGSGRVYRPVDRAASGAVSGPGRLALGESEIKRLAPKKGMAPEDEVERHYVNPMKGPNDGGNIVGGREGTRDDKSDTDHQGSNGAFAKLIRRFNVLRRRWREAKREKRASYSGRPKTLPSRTELDRNMSERLDYADELKEEPLSRRQGGHGVIDVKAKEDLEMACRRMLDALLMSAKRGSDTLSLSVSDGRTLLASLMAAGGPVARAGIDLGATLPRPPAAGSTMKPRLPVVGGASGPFARAARQYGSSFGATSGSGGSGHTRPGLGEAKTPPLQSNFGSFSGSGTSPEKQQEAMERAMGVAMGMLSPFAVAPSHGGGDSGDKDDEVGEWLRGTAAHTPSCQRRKTPSRTSLHTEIRFNSANKSKNLEDHNNDHGRTRSGSGSGSGSKSSKRSSISSSSPSSGAGTGKGARRSRRSGHVGRADGRGDGDRSDSLTRPLRTHASGKNGKGSSADSRHYSGGGGGRQGSGKNSAAVNRPERSDKRYHRRDRNDDYLHETHGLKVSGSYDGAGDSGGTAGGELERPKSGSRGDAAGIGGGGGGREDGPQMVVLPHERHVSSREERRKRLERGGHHHLHERMGGGGVGIAIGGVGGGDRGGYQASVTETTASVLSDESLSNMRF